MANQLNTNVTEKLMRAFIPAFESERKISKLVTTNAKNLVDNFDETTGDTFGAVRMKRPLQFTPQQTADGNLTGVSANPISVGTVPAEVGDYFSVFVEMTDVERALESADVDLAMAEVMQPAAEDICNAVESDLVDRMNRAAALSSGDPDNAINDWADIAAAGTKLDSIGLPSGSKYCIIKPFDGLALSADQRGLQVNPEVGMANQMATIANKYAGFDSVMTQDNMPTYTAGTQLTGLTVQSAPTQTYAATKDSYRQTIAITGGTSGNTLRAGQTVVIGGVNMVHLRNHKPVIGQNNALIPLTLTVLEDATFDGSGNANVNFSGCSIFEAGINGAYNTVDAAIVPGATVTVQESTADRSYSPGLAFHQAFFGMGSIKLKKFDSTDTSFTTKDGLNFRIAKDANVRGNSHQMRIDFRPTYACLNPFFGEKVHGL
jgi:hypothetical protein